MPLPGVISDHMTFGGLHPLGRMPAFRAVSRYEQRPGAITETGEHLGRLGADQALVAGGQTALDTVEEDLLAGLRAADLVHTGTVRGIDESTEERVEKIAVSARDGDCDLVIGVGGCTAIDAAKAAANRAATTFVAIPTLASADGPAGGLSVIYDEAGRPVDVERADDNPALVLVDSSVIADAPVHFLRWGLGDAVSTRFEAEACARTDATTIHGLQRSDVGTRLARRTYAAIAADGAQALADVARDEPTPAVQSIVETVHLTSVLGWENGGLAGAHALEAGLRASGITDPPHGLLVALCTLAELVWQDHEAVDELSALLAELGFRDPLPADADLAAGAEVACSLDLMDNEPLAVTPSMAVDALGTARRRLADAMD